MCGRYSFFETEQLYERFHAPKGEDVLREQYNVAPGSEMPVVKQDGRRHIAMLRWGLTPPWAKDTSRGTVINARVETLEQRPMFRKLLAGGRCLIPANGWFEWRLEERKKIPYFLRRKDSALFAFAGLRNENKYAIITTDALPSLESIHTRMPLVLSPKDENLWLNPEVIDFQHTKLPIVTSKEDNLVFFRVNLAVNRPTNNSPDLVKPLERVGLWR